MKRMDTNVKNLSLHDIESGYTKASKTIKKIAEKRLVIYTIKRTNGLIKFVVKQ